MLDVAFLSSGKLISSFKSVPVAWPVIATLLGNIYLLLLATVILACFMIGICLTYKYIPYLLTDFRNASNNEIPELALKLWWLPGSLSVSSMPDRYGASSVSFFSSGATPTARSGVLPWR